MVQSASRKRDRLQPVQRVRVKIVDFKKVAQIQKEFGTGVGICDFDKRTIYINSTQPVVPKSTQGVILWHEKGHLLLDDCGILYTKRARERFCDLYACMRAPVKCLSPLELMLRQLLLSLPVNPSTPKWLHVIRMAHGRTAEDTREFARWCSDSRILCQKER